MTQDPLITPGTTIEVSIVGTTTTYISTGLVSVQIWCALDACEKKSSKNRFLTKNGKFGGRGRTDMSIVGYDAGSTSVYMGGGMDF